MKRVITVLLIILSLLGTGFVALFYDFLFPTKPLTVASWGGVYAHAQGDALFIPYTDKTKVPVNVALYGGGLAEIRQQVAAKSIAWDVVDMELPDAEAACREGLLETRPQNLGNETDFVPGALGQCWIGTAAYAQVATYDKARVKAWKAAPIKLADFFDPVRFPGARALRDAPHYTLEMALLADNVAPSDIYKTLETEDGVARAFAMLDRLKPALLFWTSPAETLTLLQGRAAFAMTLSGRAFEMRKTGTTIWDGQVYGFDVFVRPKGADPRAEQFLRFASEAKPLAVLSRWLPLGPARRSALALVEANIQTGEDMRPFLPTTPENFTRALAYDPAWWAQHGAKLNTRWEEWRKP